jgi:peptidoglycan/LPS O-acetylase OafA/YrhL
LNENKISKVTKPIFLGYLHSFRALAILNIVLGHAMAAAFIGAYGAFDDSNLLLMVSEIFYHDSTLYFAIISGLLFSKILKPKGYFRFYKSKFNHILLPYFFVTLVLTLTKINFNSFSSFESLLGNTLNTFWVNFLYGKASFALWYIPVLLFLYVMTPVLDFLESGNRFSKLLFFISMLLPLFVSRINISNEYVIRFETLVYFTGAYSFGMFLGNNLNEKLTYISKHKTLLIGIAILSTVCLFYLYIQEFDMIGTVNIKETIFYIQKTCFALLFIIFFYHRNDKQPKWMYPIARDSFSIYFIHGPILYLMLPYFRFILEFENLKSLTVVIVAAALFIISVLFSRIIVILFNKIFGKYSRMIIGS